MSSSSPSSSSSSSSFAFDDKKAIDPRVAGLVAAAEDSKKGTLKAPRLATALSAFIALRVEVPTTGQSDKIKLSPYTTVRDTMALITKEMGVVTSEPFGLYAKVIRDGAEIGIWLLEDRTLWSYQLEDLTLVEFKPKTPEHHEVRIVVPSQEIVSNLSYDQFTTVKEVINDIMTQHSLPDKEKYAIYLTRESLWLNEAETLASYQLTSTDTLEYKKRTGDNEEKPKSVLLDIGLPQHNTTRKLLVSLTTTVAEVISMLLRKAAVLDTSNYGLYLMPREGRPGMWMEDYKFLASFPLENEEKLEFKSKFKQFVIEVNISSRQRPASLTHEQRSSGLVMKPLVDDSATVGEAIEMVISEYSLNSNRNYGLFMYDEDQLAPERKLFDVGNKEPLVFHAVRKPLRFALETEPQNIETLHVDFDEVLSKIAQSVARRFGVSQHASYRLKTGDTALSVSQSLFDYGVAENSLLLLQVDSAGPFSGPGGLHRRSIPRTDSRLEEGDYDVNIWDEGPDADTNIIYENVADNEGIRAVRAGSFNKLIERLTDSKTPDLKYVKTFLLTYQSFTTPERLLQKLIERYNVVRAKNATYADFQITQKSIQARVCNAMKLWMESPQPDFEENEELQEALLAFIRDTLALDSPKLAKQLRNTMQKAKQGGAFRERNFGFDSNAPEVKVPKNMNENLTLTDFDPEEIARQMTLIDFRFFASIKPAELLNQAWNKEKHQHKAKNVMALIKRINDIGSLVATSILVPKDPKIRAKIFTVFINVASHLFAINNFSTCMAVIGGLNNSSILRLKHTKKEVDKKLLKKLADLEKALSPESNYRALRDLLHKVNPPCFPYLGVYTSDLTFLDDGNPNFINDLVNFEKRRLVYSIISDLITYQDKPYNFMPFPELKSLLMNIEVITDKELYEYSLKREPRE